MYNIPFNVLNSNSLVFKNLITKNAGLNLLNTNPYINSPYHLSEKDQTYNYSSKLGVFELPEGSFNSNYNGNGGKNNS